MGIWVCECDGENQDEMRFCGRCGKARPESWSCAACGGENAPEMRFCGHCGNARAPDTLGATGAASAGPDALEAEVSDPLRSFVSAPVADRLIEGGGQLTEERRLVTALFADISGFTPLASRLDPEELMEVIDPVVSMLSTVVGRYEGYVEKFAGDALLALFGAPVSHEDDAARALRVAREMHSELARIRTDLPHAADLTLHVGVNSGHGIARIIGSEVRTDYGVLGDAVILAQRLESVTPAGETYVSASTYELTRDIFEFEPVGGLTLKGKSEPVPAWRLLAEKAPSIRAGERRSLVGRDAELGVARPVLEALLEGRGGVLAVTGEPGVGKSRLTEEIRRQAEADGVAWLETRCISYGGALPYWPFAELVRRAVGIRPEDAPAEASAILTAAVADPVQAGFFARLTGLPMTQGAADVAGLEPDAFRRGLHDAFAHWLRGLAAARPLVVAVEDTHWADASSLALAAELAHACSADPVVLYLTGRSESEEALAAISSDQFVALALEPLGEADLERLIAAQLESPPPAALVRLVVETTGGNPFFAQELVRALQDEGVLARRNGRWRLRRGRQLEEVPPTLEEVLAARIDALPRQAARALQAASVVGRRIRLPLLGRLVDEAVLSSLLEVLVERGFLDPAGDDELVFHHALVQDVAYARLLRKHRRELHLRTAEAAEALYGSGDDVIDLLARHLYLGEAGAKAFAYLLRAGERSKALYANDEAIVHLARAAEVARADGEVRAGLPAMLLSLADLHELVGDYEEALELYGEVRAAMHDIRAWRGLASVHRRRGEYEEALAIVDEAIAADELRGQDLGPLWLEAGWSLSLSGRLDQAIDVLTAGLEALAPRRDPVVGQLLRQLATTEALAGRLDGALEHVLAAQAIFEEHSDERGLASTMRQLGDVHMKAGRLDEAALAARRGLELAERVGSVEEIGGCLINIGFVEGERQAFQEAIECDRRAIEEFERVGHGSGRARGYANLAYHLMQAGEYDEAERWCRRTLELSRAIGHSVTVADAIDTLAAIEVRRENFSAGAERAEEAAALYLEMGSPSSAAQSLELARSAWEQAGDELRARDAEARARSIVDS
jgi:adenylate cyclase